METAPTSTEVLLRPTLGQSDEPSDLRGSLSPTSVYSTWQSPGGHPSNYEPGATFLNFSDRANHDERTPYSVFQEDATGSKPTGSKLKLNPSKTEFILTGIKLQRDKILNNFLCLILGQDTNPSSSANNLGVVFDSSLNFQKHISRTCRACFYHISDLRRIRKKLSLDLAKALVSSKLDYCNSLFYNIPENNIARLQCVQNCVNQGPTFSHSSFAFILKNAE